MLIGYLTTTPEERAEQEDQRSAFKQCSDIGCQRAKCPASCQVDSEPYLGLKNK